MSYGHKNSEKSRIRSSGEFKEMLDRYRTRLRNEESSSASQSSALRRRKRVVRNPSYADGSSHATRGDSDYDDAHNKDDTSANYQNRRTSNSSRDRAVLSDGVHTSADENKNYDSDIGGSCDNSSDVDGYRSEEYESGNAVDVNGRNGYRSEEYDSGNAVDVNGDDGYRSEEYDSGDAVDVNGDGGYRSEDYDSSDAVDMNAHVKAERLQSPNVHDAHAYSDHDDSESVISGNIIDDRNELSENGLETNGFEVVGHRSAPARSSYRSSGCNGLCCDDELCDCTDY